MGFGDSMIAMLCGVSESAVWDKRKEYGIKPVYKMVDTCAAEFSAVTPYYYSTYDMEDEVDVKPCKKVIVLGSGPIRIGQGIEFDYCSVHAVWALKEAGVEAIIINNNPETVSTDFDTADELYFEPLTLENVMEIVEKEKPAGVLVQFGGQTAVNLAVGLADNGVKILGTLEKNIDIAEDREKFALFLNELNIPQSEGDYAFNVKEAHTAAKKMGYPLLVRPSYVIGGQSMNIVRNDKDLADYVSNAIKISPGRPILIDKYIEGTEAEVDAVCDGDNVLIAGIMEHIERAGVHSGDSFAVYPPRTLKYEEKQTISEYTYKIAQSLHVKGLINIQFVIKEGRVFIIEVNPRASRTVPILSKVTGIPMVNAATKICLGYSLPDLGYRGGTWPENEYTVVKAPVFSHQKLKGADLVLGPEMKSTGEALGIGLSFEEALYKAFLGGKCPIPEKKRVYIAVSDAFKKEAVPVIALYASMGYNIISSGKTGKLLQIHTAAADIKVMDSMKKIVDMIKGGMIDIVIDIPTKGRDGTTWGYKIRRAALDYGVTCMTSIDTARAYAHMLKALSGGMNINVLSMKEYSDSMLKSENA